MSFVKLFDAIKRSTIWDKDPVVRLVWISVLLEADRNGNFQGTREYLARSANLTLDEFNRAFDVLLNVDPNSTSPEEDGRRIVNISTNLWSIVNYKKYRALRDPDEEREKKAEWKRKERERKRDVASCRLVSPDVAKSRHIADADADAEAEIKGRKRPRFTVPSVEDVRAYCREKEYRIDPEAFVDFYTAKGWRVGAHQMKDWQAAVRNWARRQQEQTPAAKPKRSAREEADEWARQQAAAGGDHAG